jgi:hypothetical protein
MPRSPNDAATVADVTVTGGTDSVNVPEPATPALLGLGLLTLAAARRRRG